MVTGGSGYIGSQLISRLHGQYDIVILDWEEPPASIAQLVIEKHIFDIAVPESWAEIGKCDFVFHAAAQTSAVASEENPVRDFLSNVCGSFFVAEYARKYSAKVIYCNSVRVYDIAAVHEAIKKYGMVSEDCPTIDISDRSPKMIPPFALSKNVGEQYLWLYAQKYGIKVISHRMSGIVGPSQIGSQKHAWLSYLVECAVKGTEYTIYGKGNQTRDVLHIDDFLDLIELELKNFDHFAEKGFAFYNVGGGTSNKLSIKEVIRLLKEKHKLNLLHERTDFRQGEPRHYATNLTRIAKRGWYPKHNNPEKIIAELVEWHRRK